MARNFVEEHAQAYPVANEVAVQTLGKPVDFSAWCDTVEDFEDAAKRGLELRYEGLISYERSTHRWVGCRPTADGTGWIWSAIIGTTVTEVPATAIKLCHERHEIAPNGKVKINISFEPANATKPEYGVIFSEPALASFNKNTGIITANATEGTCTMTVTIVDNNPIDGTLTTPIQATTEIVVTKRAAGVFTPMATSDINIIPVGNVITIGTNGALNATVGMSGKAMTFNKDIKAIEFTKKTHPFLVFACSDEDHWLGCALNNTAVHPGSVTYWHKNPTFTNLITIDTTPNALYPDGTKVMAVLDENNNKKLIVYCQFPSATAFSKSFEIDLNDNRLISNTGAKDLIDNHLCLGIAGVSNLLIGDMIEDVKKVTRNPDGTPPISKIEIPEVAKKMEVGETYPIPVTVTPPESIPGRLAWQSSNEEICTVREGQVTAIKEGNCVITVSSLDIPTVIATCAIMVIPKSVKSISIPTDTSNLFIGTEVHLGTVVTPIDVSNAGSLWTSSDNSIATIDRDGRLKGVKNGTCIVTATSRLTPEIRGTKEVTVKNVTLGLNSTSKTLELGDTFTLVSIIEPSEYPVKTCNFYSSDTSIATVNGSGVITSKAIGACTILVESTKDSSISKACTLNIVPKAVTDITITPNGNSTVLIGSTLQLGTTIVPTSLNGSEVVWSSSDNSKATVSTTGLVIGVSTGNVTITAKSMVTTSKVATKDITINPVSVTGVTLSGTARVQVGNLIQTTTTITPSNATNKGLIYTVTLGDDKIIVTNTGVVLGKAIGSGQIKVTTSDGGYSSTREIEVVA